MAVLTVTTANDVINAGDGVLSLREAVAQSNATATVDTIQFASTIERQTLLLSGGELVISRDVNIDGDLNNDGREVTLSGGLEFSDFNATGNRVLNIVGGETDVELRDLTLADGYSRDRDQNGGAVLLGGGGLTLTGCTVRDSSTGDPPDTNNGAGGGLYAAPGIRLTILDSTFSNLIIRDIHPPFG